VAKVNVSRPWVIHVQLQFGMRLGGAPGRPLNIPPLTEAFALFCKASNYNFDDLRGFGLTTDLLGNCRWIRESFKGTGAE